MATRRFRLKMFPVLLYVQVWFEGSFAEYEEDLRQRNGGKEPKRPKFRPLPTV